MIVAGIELKRPSFWGLTSAVVTGVALWALLLTISPFGAKDAVGAGAILAAIVWGCVSNAIGIELRRGGRHLALNILGCVAILALYRFIANFIG